MELLTSCFVILISLCFCFYLYVKVAYKYWCRKGVPYLEPTFPYGNLNSLVGGQGIGIITRRFYDEFKKRGCKFGGVYALTNPLFIPVDLGLIRDIMTKDFQHFSARGVYYNENFDPLAPDLFNIDGPRWKNIRTRLSPNYSSGKMKLLFQMLVQCAENMNEILRTFKNDPVDIKEICCCYTTDINALCSFGLNCKSLFDHDVDFRKFGRKFFETNLRKEIKHFLSIAMPKIARNIGIVTRDRKVTNYFKTTFEDIIEYRKKYNINNSDLLQSLIYSMEEKEENIDELKRNLTENEVLAQCLLFFIASFETSSTAMNFCMYELARNAEIQQKLREEIEECVEKYGGFTYEAVTNMKYLAQVLDETMRMYTPVPTLNRECVKDYIIPETNIIIKRGTSVLIPAYGVHHDPDFYSNPENFNPDRFNEGNKGKIPPHAFLPFGEGPRNCIGLRFGLLQVKIGVAMVVKKFRFKVHENTENLVIDAKSFLFRSENTILLEIEEILVG